jgi:peroxisomal 3,2-trans-enoyl-CoA isomerase
MSSTALLILPFTWVSRGSGDCFANSANLNPSQQASFVTLALAPEAATSLSFPLRMGLGRASEALIFARKMEAQELLTSGYVNRIFPKETFHADVHAHLKSMLVECNPRSMFAAKRIIRQSLDYGRKVSSHLLEEVDFVADQYARGEPVQAFAKLAERQARLREEKKKAKL